MVGDLEAPLPLTNTKSSLTTSEDKFDVGGNLDGVDLRWWLYNLWENPKLVLGCGYFFHALTSMVIEGSGKITTNDYRNWGLELRWIML